MKKLITIVLCLTFAGAIAAPDSLPKNDGETQVMSAYKLGNVKQTRVGLFDIIGVRVKGFQTLLNRVNGAGGAKTGIKLFLDGRQIDGLPVIIGEPKNGEGELQFTLERNKQNDATWSGLLGSPDGDTFFTRPMDVSVGLDKSYAEKSVARLNFIRIEQGWFYGCLLAVIIYFIILIYYGHNYNLLRNPSIDLSALNIDESLGGVLSPYSLGKVQMAFWFSLVLISFLFIWLITGNYDLITPGILGLIGISGGTALGAVVIDNNKTQDTIKQILALQQQQSIVFATISNLKAQNPPAPSTAGDIQYNDNLNNQLTANIDQLLKSLQLKTEWFLPDMLTDSNGYNFHRLQMFIWTIVLGVVFTYSVWSELTMPDFSATMLAVQGITAGTYLGFKFPEKQA